MNFWRHFKHNPIFKTHSEPCIIKGFKALLLHYPHPTTNFFELSVKMHSYCDFSTNL